MWLRTYNYCLVYHVPRHISIFVMLLPLIHHCVGNQLPFNIPCDLEINIVKTMITSLHITRYHIKIQSYCSLLCRFLVDSPWCLYQFYCAMSCKKLSRQYNGIVSKSLCCLFVNIPIVNFSISTSAMWSPTSSTHSIINPRNDDFHHFNSLTE